MNEAEKRILVINGGSSSIRFSLFHEDLSSEHRLSGKIERIGLPGTILTWQDTTHPLPKVDTSSIPDVLFDWLDQEIGLASVTSVGHRIVHGARHSEPQLVTEAVMDELRSMCPYDPEHMPAEIGLIESLRRRHPTITQVVCFDTDFHRTMPRVAQILPIPRRFQTKGIQRYGFHGLSYSYLMEELTQVAGATCASGRVILLHLGNGASMAAVHEGRSLDTSMAFTPTAGLPMGTRSGDLDPGLVWYLAETQKMTAEQFHRMVNHESGLLGISETSPDMRDLLDREVDDVRAAEAVAYFCYQVKKWIGAFAAVLGGLDTLVFAGGIGENVPVIRARCCEGLDFLGIELDDKRNECNRDVISTIASQVAVRVIPTDEEVMIAKSVHRIIKTGKEDCHE